MPEDPSDDRVVVTGGGRWYETDEDGRLVGGLPDGPASTDLRRPLRLDGATAAAFVHFAHPIPISRGFRRAWVALNAPGWTGNDLFDALRAAGLVDRSGPMPKLVAGVRWVEVERDGTCSRVEREPVAPRRHRRR